VRLPCAWKKSSHRRHTAIRLLKGCAKIYHPEQFPDDNFPAGAGSQKNKKGQTMPYKSNVLAFLTGF
jgi:hypothetical protein